MTRGARPGALVLVRAGPGPRRGAYHGECGGGAAGALVRGVQGARTMASAGRGRGSADPPSPEAAAWAGRCLLCPSFLPIPRL